MFCMDGSEGAEVAGERSLAAASDIGSGCFDLGRGVHWELDSDAVGLPRGGLGVSYSICEAPHMSFAAVASYLYNRRCQLNVIYLIVAGSLGLRYSSEVNLVVYLRSQVLILLLCVYR
ncbi:hypothetical protein Nepgr_021673 [Nepenthes gracilis]|uniref:Uncharacterized protein n=1 Tax=Nepenthes gracilis TaxID=150966 RepID=A0AAD3T0G1_NEPGR|nr:hypothetical protein Nepgr_021673 [Nepenthes gracilis]